MRHRLAALLLAGALLLSGCAAMTDRDYLSIQPHKDALSAGNDPSVFRVENYTELGEAIHGMVEAGVEHGVVHLSNYAPRSAKGDVEADLADACAEVAQRDPLGAYAVDFIKHDKAYIVSYYEANIYITYRRTPEQVKSIVSVTGTSAVRTEIQEALSGFSAEKVLRISYFAEDAAAIRDLVRQAYYASPLFALGMPEIEVDIYPSDEGYTGALRIVEILLTYPEDQETLRKQAQALAQRAGGLSGVAQGLGGEASARAIDLLLKSDVTYLSPEQKDGPQRRNTAYAALVEGTADSEGLALAYQLLAEQEGLESYVVSGAVGDTPHFWNIVGLPDGEYRHVDVTAQEGVGLSDADLVALGYRWDRSAYRACGAQPPPEEAAPESAAGETGAVLP
ncbi:MAG TPA: hypothetical protein VN421_11815 [Pseudoflavonifractor sp.]|nr:hypothetical protein [Pseudoflavonifractor sp.]